MARFESTRFDSTRSRASRLAVVALLAFFASTFDAGAQPPGTKPPFHLPAPLGIGTVVEPSVYAAWNIDVQPDGQGLPPGRGDAERGEALFVVHCAGCHTVGLANAQGFPVLAGGLGSLATSDPEMTVGSYWPYATTLYDYVHRAMPFPEPQSLTADEIYSLAAFILAANGIIARDVVLDQDTLPAIEMPNRHGFTSPDPRPDTANVACIVDCPPLATSAAETTASTNPDGDPPPPVRAASDPPRSAAEVAPAEVVPAELPFDVRLVPVDVGIEQGIHSAATAVARGGEHAGAWLIAGGRTNGLHRTGNRNLPPERDSSFPRRFRNDRLWAVDPVAGRAASVPVTGLPERVRDALISANQQSVQDERTGLLWIVGGYGWSTEAQEYGTFGLLIAVEVDELVTAIFAHDGGEVPELASYFSWGTTEAGCLFFGQAGCVLPPGRTTREARFDLTVTGGGLETIDGDLALVLGQRFGGEYNATGASRFAQVYTCRVLRFPPPEPAWGGTFEVAGVTVLAAGADDCGNGDAGNADDPFHRRDLNVVPLVLPTLDGEVEGIGVYGGVFTADFSGHVAPILIDADGARVRDDAAQTLCQYEAPEVSFFDGESGSTHTLILGGMGAAYCTAGEERVATPRCTRTETITPPAFMEDGTILSWSADGTFSQVLLYRPFRQGADAETELLGTNAHFLLRPDVPTTANGVVRLDLLDQDRATLIGYVFGGVATDGEAPRNVFFSDGPSWASKRAFEVWVRPRG